MAEDKITKGMMSDVLRELRRKKDTTPSYEKVSSEAVAKAREGRGLIGGLLAGEKARMEVAREYQIATKGTLGRRQAFFEGMLGRDLGDLFKNLGLEKMESPEKIKEARAKFQLDKKDKDGEATATKSIGKLSKPISLILRKVIENQKLIQKIQQNITKPSSNSRYIFDPRMGTGGRFRDTETQKLVSSKVALGDTSRTDALTAAIGADETPLVKLREFLEFKFKDFDAQKLNKQLKSMDDKLDMILLAVGINAVSDLLPDVNRRKTTPGKPDAPNKPGVPPGKPNKPDAPKGGRFGKIAGLLGKAGGAISGAGAAGVAAAGKIGAGAAELASKAASLPGVSTAAKIAGKVAVPLAVATTGYEATKAGMNAEQTLGIQGREATAGETAAAAAGGAVEGLTFGLVSAKTVGTGLVTAGEAVKGATSKLFNWATGKGEDLNKVTTKQNSGVDTSNFEGGFEDRLAKMAAKFQEVTGNKLMITSGYRSEEKQKQLWDAKKAELTKAHPNWSAAQIDKAVGKLVARPVAYGGKGSRHNSGLAVDVNSKGSAGIEAINGAEIGGQKVTTDSFLAKYGLFRPMKHEPWHIQPLGDKPMPDNPDPTAKPLVADASGKPINLETGRTEAIPRAEVQTGMSAGLESPAPISGGAQIADRGGETSTGGMQIGDRLADSGVAPAGGLGPAGQPRGPGMQIGDRLADSGITPASPGLGPAGQPRGPGMQIADSGYVAPVASTVGTQVAEGSAQLESSKMVAQASPPAPVVINNNQGSSQQPITPPKTPLPKASTRSSENAFNRAISNDFSHPSAFTSVSVV